MERFKWLTTVGPNREDLTKVLLLATAVSSLESFQYGYNFWLSSHTFVGIHGDDNTTQQEDTDVESSEGVTVREAFKLASVPLGGIVGSLLAGSLLDVCGRRGTLMVNNVISIISAILMGTSHAVDVYEFTVISSFFSGIFTGICSLSVPTYVGEISPRNVRGAIITLPIVFLGLGHLTAQLFTLRELEWTKEDLPKLMSLPGCVGILETCLLPFCPESPRYLMIQKKNEKKAKEALKKLRGKDDVDDEIEEMRQEDVGEKSEKNMTLCRLLRFSALRWQVISVVVLLVGQQQSGINAVYYYSDKIFLKTGVKNENIQYINIAANIAGLLSLFVSIYIVDSLGRRKLLLFGFGISSFFCILLTMSLELQSSVPWMSYVSTVSATIFLLGHTMGPSPVPNIITVELFLQTSRSSGFVIGKLGQWLSSFLTAVIFLVIEKFFGTYIFLIFWPICTATLVYTFRFIPETKQMTFLDIRRMMDKRSNIKREELKEEFRQRSVLDFAKRNERRTALKR
ncbi:solute carrier family 2, facilitated glucose transporter member 5-like [Hemicordylus capensis]|uniref:solute carrier family 2, facilitated glucose transporter member 5-like n=1 Tax=Hemicordylus capensis TaxID=884348 RepID=UPI002303C7FC|nr:solute carrier family 2, facilitated glucose transporter member 5-like [Hemicordylus capensis]